MWKAIAPSFPFGNRADANTAFRVCACCAGNPDMPRRGCGPGPECFVISQLASLRIGAPMKIRRDVVMEVAAGSVLA